MEILIDKNNRIKATDEYFAPMKLTKQGKRGAEWLPYKWFSSLESCVEYLARKRLCTPVRALSLGEFLAEYKKEREHIQKLVKIKK